ncbi:MAG: DUF268 domain-containing protein [Desulfuromonadaceae bacterium]|nr:DUF268 domain-containing protein [Desulfuromonadaceae bacterium]
MKELFKSNPLLRSMYRFTKRIYRTVLFVFEYLQFKRLIAAGENRFRLKWKERYPCLDDNTSTSGFDRHYVYHPAWAARILADTKPGHHVDISSSLHFCSIISAFIPVRFYDYRPVKLGLGNLRSDSADLLSLPFPDRSITSLSCMHVVEHVGLGRYGDPLDPDGDLKAVEELKRVLADNGDLLFVVPMGNPPRIMFNAHRIYKYDQVRELFHDLELKEFALIPDTAGQGGLVRNADKLLADKQAYGCGCFWFRRTP